MHDIPTDWGRKAEAVREALRESILSGELGPGDRIPSETQLVDRYRVGRSTVREAVASLVQEGLLRREQGRGTFVAPPHVARRTFGVLMPYLYCGDPASRGAGTDVIPRLVEGLENEARCHEASVLLRLAGRCRQVERQNLQAMLEQRVDGIVLNYIGGEANRDCLDALRDAGRPVVLVDRYVDGEDIDYVVTDNALGACQATTALIRAGFQKVFYLTVPITNSALRDRWAGYREAMRSHALPEHAWFAETSEEDGGAREEAEAFRLVRSAAANISPPFAVLAADAPLLAGVWRALEEEDVPHAHYALGCFDEPGIPFPGDVRVVRVLQPLQDVAQRAVGILMDRLAGRDGLHQVKLDPRIHLSIMPAAGDGSAPGEQ